MNSRLCKRESYKGGDDIVDNAEIVTTHVSITPNPDPGFLASEWNRADSGYRYLLTLEKPLSYEQMTILGQLLLHMKDDGGLYDYYEGHGMTYKTAHIPDPLELERRCRRNEK